MSATTAVQYFHERRTSPTDLIEVDVHALELELGGAIVPIGAVSEGLIEMGGGDRHIHAIAVEAVLAGDGLPEGEVSIDCHGQRGWRGWVGSYQKAAPIWLP